MEKKVYICPNLAISDFDMDQTFLTAMSGTVRGYNLQGDDAAYARDRLDTDMFDDDDLW